MRRTVATLLVVASPVLMVVPADAGRVSVAVPTAVLAAPGPFPTVVPAVPEALVRAVPAVPAPVAAAPVAPAAPVAVAPAAPVATVVRPVVNHARATAAADDTAYSARLQADLCQARAIFCGLDPGGLHPAG